MSMYSDRAGVVRVKVLNSEPNIRPSLTVPNQRTFFLNYESHFLVNQGVSRCDMDSKV